MWCEQLGREREDWRLMSKLPKLKTGRTEEKLENSAFSLNVATFLKKFRVAYYNMGKMSVAMEH